ncbi:MAG: alpha/beta fold hydrolase [Elainellaceae cyanobacterium]
MLNLSSPLSSIVLGSLIILTLAYGGACWLLHQRQQQFIFFPSTQIEATPAAYGLPYNNVWISVPSPTSQPEQIHGWWLPADQSEAPVMLYLHGNGENISTNLSKTAWFHQLGFAVLLIDYRGYGLSEGDFPSESQVYEDAEAAWNYLLHEMDISPERLFVFGHSLGGAIAIELATRHPNMAGLVIEGAFTSILEMSHRTKNFGIFPIERILTQRFDSINKVRSLTMPVLYVHGTADDVVPTDMSQTLHDATLSSSDLLLVSGAGHEDVAAVGEEVYGKALRRFIKQTGYALTPN